MVNHQSVINDNRDLILNSGSPIVKKRKQKTTKRKFSELVNAEENR